MIHLTLAEDTRLAAAEGVSGETAVSTWGGQVVLLGRPVEA